VCCARGIEPRPVDDVVGVGLFALKPFAAGSLIVVEKPVLSVASDADTHALERDMARDGSPFKSLRPEVQAAVMNLRDAHGGAVKTLTGIWETNGIPYGADGQTGGLFLLLSRLNHSCAPNCARAWSETMQREELVALRDVAAGEELTSAYFDVLASRAQRRAHAAEAFGFDCHCALCVRGDDAEPWRARARALDDAVQRAMDAKEYGAAARSAEARVAWLRAHAWNNAGDVARSAFDAYVATRHLGDLRAALRFLDDAIALSERAGLKDHADTQMMRRARADTLSM